MTNEHLKSRVQSNASIRLDVEDMVERYSFYSQTHLASDSKKQLVELFLEFLHMVMVDQACPCIHTTPCEPECTCVNGTSSAGCRRCCSYGSKEQQRFKAEWLAKKIDTV